MTTFELSPPVLGGDDTFSLDPDRSVSVSESLVKRLVACAPASVIDQCCDRELSVDGFRKPSIAPRPRLYQELKRHVRQRRLLSLLFGLVSLPLIKELATKERDEIEPLLQSLSEEYGADVVHYALLADSRESVRAMASLVPAPSGEHPRAGASPQPSGHGRVQPSPSDRADDRKHKDQVAKYQREIRRLERALRAADEASRSLREQIGQRDHEIGNLRRQNEALNQENARLGERIRLLDREIHSQRGALHEQTALEARERELGERQKAVERIFGADGRALMNQAVDSATRAHDLESQLSALGVLLEQRERRQLEIVDAIRTITDVPLDRCVRAVAAHIRTRFSATAESASDAKLTLHERSERTERLGALIRLEQALSRLDTAGANVPIAALLDRTPRELADELAASLTQSIRIEGRVYYEGPSAWLDARNICIELPTWLVDEHKMVTGDRLTIDISPSSHDLVSYEVYDFEETPRAEVTDALRSDDEGLWVHGQGGQPIRISDVEFFRSGLGMDAPVLVQIPAPAYLGLPGDTIIYGRVIKTYETHARLQAGARRARRTANRQRAVEAETLPNLLENRKILVIGGDRIKSRYESLITAMGGQFNWQSGFAKKNAVEGKVKAADTVVIVTGQAFHSVTHAAELAARKHRVPFTFLNSTGTSSLHDLIVDLFTPDLDARTAHAAHAG